MTRFTRFSRFAPSLALACCLLVHPLPAQSDEQGNSTTTEFHGENQQEAAGAAPHVSFRDGLWIEDPDRGYHLQFGGRIASDWTVGSFDEGLKSGPGGLSEMHQIRRARLALTGGLGSRLEFRVQYDFVASWAGFRDLHVTLRHLPLFQNIRAGQFKEPFSLEELTAISHTPTMEPSLSNVFSPSRNTGAMAFGYLRNGRITWAAGGFRGLENLHSNVGREDLALTGRLTGLPWYSAEERKLAHLGLSYSRRYPTADRLAFAQRPEARLAPTLAATGEFAAKRLDLLAIEGAWQYTRWSIQTEYKVARWIEPDSSSHHFSGFYVLGTFSLTGDPRNYKVTEGAFNKIRPRHPVFDGGTGAWEVSLRHSRLDLSDGPVSGGKNKNTAIGLSWDLNAFVRVCWNYIRTELEDQGKGSILQMRLQLDF